MIAYFHSCKDSPCRCYTRLVGEWSRIRPVESFPNVSHTGGEMAKKQGSFQSKARQIAKKQGVSVKRGQAILASATRKASPAAKRKNPALKKVK